MARQSTSSQRMAWQKRSRRSILRGAVIGSAGMTAAFVLACGGSDDDSAAGEGTPQIGQSSTGSVDASEPPQSGGKLITALIPGFTYQHLEPSAGVWTSSFTWPTHNLLVRLDTSNPDQTAWKVVPDAAAHWEAPDATTYVFTLADGLKFHDIAPTNGRDATSDDVRFSLERMATNKPQFFRQKELSAAKIETPDAKTIKLTFPQPQGAFWTRITTPGTVILPREVAQTEGELIRSGQPVPGTGPFIHDQFQNEQIYRVRRNPAYFKQGLPYLDSYEAIFTPNRDANFVAFKAGQLDVGILATREQWDEAKNLRDVTRDRRLGFQTQWVVFHTEKPPWNDPRVRRAIHLATPRQEIVDICHRGEEDGVMLGPGGLNPWAHGSATWSYDELKTRPGYRTGDARKEDIAEAKKLLAAAGVPQFKGVLKYTSHTTSWPYNDTLNTLLQEAYREIGFDFTLEPYSYSDTLVNLANRDFDIYSTPQWANGIDPNEYLEFYFADGGVRNYGAWKNERYNKLLADQNAAADPAARNTIIRKMLEILEQEVPRAPLNNWAIKVGWYNKVRGWNGHYATTSEVAPDRLWVKQ